MNTDTNTGTDTDTGPVLHVIRAGLREVGWLLRGTSRLAVRHPRTVAALLVVLGGAWALHRTDVLALALGAVVSLTVWCRLRPVSFDRWCSTPVRQWQLRRWVRAHWAEIATGCGLSVSASTPVDGSSGAVVRLVPELRSVATDGPRLRLRLRLRLGQTLDDVEAAAEKLRSGVNATRVRVEPDGPVHALVTFTMGDSLSEPFDALRPSLDSSAELGRVLMGRVEDGSPWWLPLGPHTLTVGCSGAGKGSVFWSFAFGLAPAVRSGLVRLYGIDLKGGMEVRFGEPLFSMHATDAAEAVAILELLVGLMKARTTLLAGKVRTHTPTVVEPMHVVMIDELAALTAYCPDRDLRQRAETAISMLCSQGRAPGVMVFACLQDPRKDVVPNRGLFTQMIGLRLKDNSETLMVLGESASESGAACHRIPPSMPGVGYVIPEHGGHPIRVRAGYADDDAIRDIATTFATPYVEPVVVIDREPTPRPRGVSNRKASLMKGEDAA